MRIRQQRTSKINICKKMILFSACMILMVSTAGCGNKKKENLTITNVSYDPTRELYEQYNKVFAEHWKEQTGQEVEVTQSHGGSGKQALEVAISEQIKISPGRTAGPLHRGRFFAENNLFIHDKRSFHCRSCNGSFHKVLRL